MKGADRREPERVTRVRRREGAEARGGKSPQVLDRSICGVQPAAAGSEGSQS